MPVAGEEVRKRGPFLGVEQGLCGLSGSSGAYLVELRSARTPRPSNLSPHLVSGKGDKDKRSLCIVVCDRASWRHLGFHHQGIKQQRCGKEHPVALRRDTPDAPQLCADLTTS